MTLDITLSEALSDKKNLSKEITKKTVKVADTLTIVVGDNAPKGFKDQTEYKATIKSKHQSIVETIEHLDKISRAIAKTNANTIITIGNLEMTIAEMLTYEKTILPLKAQLLEKLTSEYNNVTKNHQLALDIYQNSLNTYIQEMFSKREKSSIKHEETKAAQEQYEQNNKPKLVDPLDIKKVIDELQNEIETFEREVDKKKTLINATTKIIIE